jgi:hypothetical protein
MTDGLNLDGFTANRKPAGTNDINASGDYSPATGSFPAAQDKSSQGPAGVTNKMVHSVEETRNFGAGN